MEYEIIEVQGMDGIEEHVVIQMPNNGKLTFPAVDSNPNYIQFKLDLAKEQNK